MSAPVDVLAGPWTCENCGEEGARAIGGRICTACVDSERERSAAMPDTKAVDVRAVLDAHIAWVNGLWQELPQNPERKRALLDARSARKAFHNLTEAVLPLTSAAHDSGLMADILKGMRPHEAATMRDSIMKLDAALRACGGA